MRAARAISNTVNARGEQRFSFMLRKRPATRPLVVCDVSANVIRGRNAWNVFKCPIRREPMSGNADQLSFRTERQRIPVVCSDDFSVLKTQVLYSPVRVREHRLPVVSFQSTRSLGERINPLRAFCRLFKIEQLAVRLSVQGFTSLKVIQARNFTFKRSENIDQLRKA